MNNDTDDEPLLPKPIEFWDARHDALDAWRSGGDRGLSEEENREFYAYRLGRIVELIRKYGGAERRLRVLDAGCGRGHMAGSLRQFGHWVTGVDASVAAITWARDKYGDGFERSELEKHRPHALYDVVLCLDVMFHILDDDEWARTLQLFGRSMSAESILIVTDAMGAARFQLGDYIVQRDLAAYQQALAPGGFSLAELLPYNFGSNPNQFAVFRRRLKATCVSPIS